MLQRTSSRHSTANVKLLQRRISMKILEKTSSSRELASSFGFVSSLSIPSKSYFFFILPIDHDSLLPALHVLSHSGHKPRLPL